MSLTDILSPSDIAAALRDCQGEKTTKTLSPFLLCSTQQLYLSPKGTLNKGVV